MNRIVLIGNGFDLAHGLKTRYQDFIDWYREQRILGLKNEHSAISEDELIILKYVGDTHNTWNSFCYQAGYSNVTDWKFLYEKIYNNRSICDAKFSLLYNATCRSIESKGWVDIENEYYTLLKWIIFNDDFQTNQKSSLIEQLDKQLACMQALLIKYLSGMRCEGQLVNDAIRAALYSPISPEEVCVAQREWFEKQKEDTYKGDISELKSKLLRYNVHDISRYSIEEAAKAYRKGDLSEFNSHIHPGEENLWALPEQIMFLSFNYTKTIDNYCPQRDSHFTVNHIHGTLNNPESVIFGYGDELDEKYKEIRDKNENTYLRNIKSIRYLESDNYRKMLQFIDSAPFQIYIVGHSCGNSDRTLLNTLFEHKNCISIKPFYYTWTEKDEDGTELVKDNYLELVQNISRNFTDMKLMRDRVVNKTYCKEITKNLL